LESKVLPEPVLVGRERELEELEHYLQLATEGKGTTVFVSGEAGSGKTRLLAEFLKTVDKEATVLAGWCLSDAAVPYFPFVEAFDSCLSNNGNDGAAAVNQRIRLKSWLTQTNQPESDESPMPTQPQVWKDRAFQEVSKELLFLSAKKPLILALEDIHWADSASLALLHYLARQVSTERILILATFRREELASDMEGHQNPLSKVLLLMGRDSLYREVALPSLSMKDVKGIAESMLGGGVYEELVERLTSDSQGNPLFVVESLRMLYQQGSLVEKDGRWSLRGPNLKIPPKVQDVILHRLSILKADQRRILDVASVIGERFNPKLVAAVVCADYEGVLIALNEIEKTTLMVHHEGEGYRFTHSKFQEMLYEEIPPLLRKEYHLRIAEELEVAIQNGVVTPSDLALHYSKADNKVKAIQYSLQAGRIAVSKFSNSEAIRHFTDVITAAKDNQEFNTERLIALEGLGDAFYGNSMFKEAAGTFEELAKTSSADTLKLRAFRKAMESAFQRRDASLLVELVKKAEPYVAADRLESARVLFSRGRAFLIQGKHRENLESYKAALQVFEEEGSLWDAASALLGIGVAQGILSMSPEAVAAALQSIAIFEELGDYRMQMEAYFAAGVTFNMCFLEHEALDLLAKVIEIDGNTKMGDYSRVCHAYNASAMSYELMGDFEKALSYSLKALELSEKTDSLWAQGQVYSHLTSEFAACGDLQNSELFFEKLIELPPEVLMQPALRGVMPKAVLLAAKGRWKPSNRYFQESFEWLKAHGPVAEESVAKLYYAWALEKQGRFKEARVQLEERLRMRREVEEKFEHTKLLAHLMAPQRARVGQMFEARLDIVNVSKANSLLVRVENLLNPKFTVTHFPEDCTMRNDTIYMNEEELRPFQVKTVKLILQANQLGTVTLSPKVFYIDEFGKPLTCIVNKVCVTVHQVSAVTDEERVAEPPQISFEFKSVDTQKAFDFLIKAFLEDYVRKKLPLEKSGWRTLMEMVKNGKVSRYGAYGSHGYYGHRAIAELEQRGLVEARVFSGERGRGGKILKLRILYENQSIRGRLVAKK
jgi:tetratricopeptide (TPR) repeat protein